MPTNTPRLGIPKPLGNETVSRAAFNTIYDTIDANAATRKEPEVLAQDIFASGFVVNGMVASKNATVANQLDVTAGACYAQQADGGLRRFAPAAASFTTTEASVTYYLDFQPDGTYSWGTAHSTQTGYLPIAEVTTDSAGNIATVTDKRPLVPGIGKVNADLLRSRDLAAEHDAHLADNMPHSSYVAQLGASNQVVNLFRALNQQIDTRSVTLTYDTNDRLTTVTEKDDATTVKTTSLGYDANDNLITVTEQVGDKTITTTLNYDANGNLTSVTRSVA